ncbi:MAG: hypothetical protein Q8868_06900 [Bacteroidota bacterium]|nr:hypothetical protein [Bacteroidota bacterium]
MDNERMLEEIRRYTDPYSILGMAGRRLIRIRCPFRVRVLVDVGPWQTGDIVSLERIMVTRDLKMVYIINGRGYHFYLFRILPF